MTYAGVTDQLKKVFNTDSSVISRGMSEVNIKNEPVEYIENDTLYGGAYGGRNRSDNHWPGKDNRKPDNQQFDRNSGYKVDGGDQQRTFKKQRGQNPLDPYGNVTRCRICDSINHWQNECPDLAKEEQNTYHGDYECPGNEYIIQMAAVDSQRFKDLTKLTLSCETINTAVLDCGAVKTVCGSTWLQQYMNTLSEEDRRKVTYSPSNNIFKFGCGNKLQAHELVRFPAVIGEKKVLIKSDVVDGDLPLLFSKESLKQAGSNLNFIDDTLEILGQKLNLTITESGHYALPLGRNRLNYSVDQVAVKPPQRIVCCKNQFDMYGNRMLCIECKSFNQWAQDYPSSHSRDYNPYQGVCHNEGDCEDCDQSDDNDFTYTISYNKKSEYFTSYVNTTSSSADVNPHSSPQSRKTNLSDGSTYNSCEKQEISRPDDSVNFIESSYPNHLSPITFSQKVEPLVTMVSYDCKDTAADTKESKVTEGENTGGSMLTDETYTSESSSLAGDENDFDKPEKDGGIEDSLSPANHSVKLSRFQGSVKG